MSVTKVSSPMIESGTKGADIASAATVVIGTDGSYFDITGTTGISTQFTVDAGRRFTLQFDGAVTITDNAAITLSGAANFTTAAGDILSFVATAANTVVQTGYSLVDGGSPVAPSGGKVLQVVSATTAGGSGWNTTSTSLVDVGDPWTVAITCAATSSKVLVIASLSVTVQDYVNAQADGSVILVRDSTALTNVNAAANFGIEIGAETCGYTRTSNHGTIHSLASPSSNSELVYKLQEA